MDNSNLQLDQKIEAILFATAHEMTVANFAKKFEVTLEDVENALKILDEKYTDHALTLIREGNTVKLVTRAEFGPMLEELRKEDLNKDLSKASAETLAIILYQNGVSRTEIEFIRGVNATYSLRALQMRGLVESKAVAGRNSLWYPTIEVLQFLGVKKISDLPDFDKTKEEIQKLLKQEPSE